MSYRILLYNARCVKISGNAWALPVERGRPTWGASRRILRDDFVSSILHLQVFSRFFKRHARSRMLVLHCLYKMCGPFCRDFTSHDPNLFEYQCLFFLQCCEFWKKKKKISHEFQKYSWTCKYHWTFKISTFKYVIIYKKVPFKKCKF